EDFANRFVQVRTWTNLPGFQIGAWGRSSMTDAGGVADISRWCKPPVTHTRYAEPRQRRRNGRRAISAAPAGARIQSSRRTGGLHHRLMSNVPSGQVAAFPALTLEMWMCSCRFGVEDFVKSLTR